MLLPDMSLFIPYQALCYYYYTVKSKSAKHGKCNVNVHVHNTWRAMAIHKTPRNGDGLVRSSFLACPLTRRTEIQGKGKSRNDTHVGLK